MKRTYNKRIMDSIIDGTIDEKEVDGIRVYRVEGPRKGEEVDGYTNFSDIIVKPTGREGE